MTRPPFTRAECAGLGFVAGSLLACVAFLALSVQHATSERRARR